MFYRQRLGTPHQEENLSNGFKFDQDGNIKVLEMTY